MKYILHRALTLQSGSKVHKSIRLLLTSGLLCALLPGCGVEGPPRAPRVEKPGKVSDLAVVQTGRTFQLIFTRPLLAADGERLTKPVEVEIFRSVTKPGAKPEELSADSPPWQTLSPEDLQKYTEGNKIVYSTTLSSQDFDQSLGSMYTFAVRGLTRGFRGRRIEGDDSNAVNAVLLDVSPPVEGLTIKTTEKALILTWTKPIHGLSGQNVRTPSGYRVYLSPTGKPGSFQPRGESASPEFSDEEFAFGHNYFYEVRALFRQDGQTAESADSAPFEITPRDTFPPAPPADLSALFSAGAVQLVWTANTEPDLAGYNVYRSENGGAPQKINTELIRTPTFEDRTIQFERHYVYSVTSVDLGHNESSPSHETSVDAKP